MLIGGNIMNKKILMIIGLVLTVTTVASYARPYSVRTNNVNIEHKGGSLRSFSAEKAYDSYSPTMMNNHINVRHEPDASKVNTNKRRRVR